MTPCVVHQPVANNAQQLITRVASERRVDHPEVLDTDRNQRQLAAVCQLRSNPGPGRGAVLQAGKQVLSSPVIRLPVGCQIFNSSEDTAIRLVKMMDNRHTVETVRDRCLPGAVAQSSHGTAHTLLFVAR